MVSKFTLINILLASAALAVPSQLAGRIARRSTNHHSQPSNSIYGFTGAASDVPLTPNWAGAVSTQTTGTFATVTGTFTVPTVSGENNSSASVGIDGHSCQDVMLQAGIAFIIGSDGAFTFSAWYQWYPDYVYDFPDITVNTGDVIIATVGSDSSTSGIAIIENQTTGVTVSKLLSSSSPLCGADAEWVVQGFSPLPNFGSVTFTSTVAYGPSSVIYTASNATIINIGDSNGNALTSVSVSGNNLTIEYIE